VKKLLIALATTVALVGPAHAASTAIGADRIPNEFVGSWCTGSIPKGWSWETWEGSVFYDRAKTCKDWHEPEDHMIITRDSLQYSGLIKCKFLETTFVKRETTRLKFWCKSNVDSEWMYEIEVVPLRGNKLMIEEVKNQ